MSFRPIRVFASAFLLTWIFSAPVHALPLSAEARQTATKLGIAEAQLAQWVRKLSVDRHKPATAANKTLVRDDALRVSVVQSLCDSHREQIARSVGGNTALAREVSQTEQQQRQAETNELAETSVNLLPTSPKVKSLEAELADVEMSRTETYVTLQDEMKKPSVASRRARIKDLRAKIARLDSSLEKLQKEIQEEIMLESHPSGPPSHIAPAPIPRVYVGIAFQSLDMLTPSDRKSIEISLTGNDGAIVTQVYPGGPAEASGMKQFDVILSVDHKKIVKADDFLAVLTKRRAGDTLALDVFRDNRHVPVTVVLRPRPKHFGVPKPL